MGADRNGSEVIVETLLNNGVDVMFANPGTTEMGVVEALDTVPGMRGILGLHENVVTGAADGYARMTGRPAVTLLHLGVGLANGVANLHNARRAGAPVINIIGEMATWHRSADPLLSMDIAALAGTVSTHVTTPSTPAAVATSTIECLEAVHRRQAGASSIATLILPHDCAREPAPSSQVTLPSADQQSFEVALSVAKAQQDTLLPDATEKALQALRQGGSKTCLFVGGRGAWKGGIEAAGEVCAMTGAVLMCENAFPRIDRGGDLPRVTRLAYFPSDAKKDMAKFSSIVFVGTRIPVAMFGYEDGISQIVDDEKQELILLDPQDVQGALKYLATELASSDSPIAVPDQPKLPKLPKGKLNPSKLCTCLALAQPEGAIIVDESLTSGGSYWQASQSCKEFTHMTLTGGSIGQGPPLSVGAAVGAPGRRVINFQADGSGLYTTQALWTQAREKLHVTTVICNNAVYQILKIEQQKQNLSQTGSAAKNLTDLGGPAVDWVSLAKGFGVEAARATTCEEFMSLMEKALAIDGPFLIEARL